jgi:hypothetical protein
MRVGEAVVAAIKGKKKFVIRFLLQAASKTVLVNRLKNLFW